MSAEISTFNFALEPATFTFDEHQPIIPQLAFLVSSWNISKFSYSLAYDCGLALTKEINRRGSDFQFGKKMWDQEIRFHKSKGRHTDIIRGLRDIYAEGPQPDNLEYCSWLNTEHFTGCVQSIRNERDRQIQEHIDLSALEDVTEAPKKEAYLPKLVVRLELIMERLAKIEEAQKFGLDFLEGLHTALGNEEEQNHSELRNRVSILNEKLLTIDETLSGMSKQLYNLYHGHGCMYGKGAKGDNDQTAG